LELQVRSDFHISLKRLSPDGREEVLGHFESSHTTDHSFMDKMVPHLQRQSPSKTLIATLSNKTLSVRLDSLSPETTGWTTKNIRIRGVKEEVQEMRWLPKDRGIALRTFENIYLVPFDAQSPKSRVKAKKAFNIKKMTDSMLFLTMRDTQFGLIVMTHEMPWKELEEYGRFGKRDRISIQRQQSHYSAAPDHEAYFLPIDDGKLGTIVSLRPHNRHIRFLNTLSNGRIAVVSYPRYGEETKAEPLSENTLNGSINTPKMPAFSAETEDAIQVYQSLSNGTLELIDTHLIGEYGIGNWSPNADRIVYTSENEIYLEVPNPETGRSKFKALSFTDEFDIFFMSNLWLNRTNDRIVASTEKRIRLWDETGEVLWTWDAPDEDIIYSVHFDQDGESILASINNQIFRFKDGKRTLLLTGKHGAQTKKSLRKSQRLQKSRHKKYRKIQEDEFLEDLFSRQQTFIEGMVPLSDGSIAFAVITLDYEERSLFKE